MSFFREPPGERQAREAARSATARTPSTAGGTDLAARPSLPAPRPAAETDAGPVDRTFPARAVWRARDLPEVGASVGVPLGEGVTSVFAGALAWFPLALFTGFAPWNYPAAAVAVVVLSYVLWSRRVVVGQGWLAIRKFGPYRLVQDTGAGGNVLRASSRGGVLVLRTLDGRRMRIRRVESSSPPVNAALRALVLGSGSRYSEQVQELLDLPVREDFGHYRYLRDAFD